MVDTIRSASPDQDHPQGPHASTRQLALPPRVRPFQSQVTWVLTFQSPLEAYRSQVLRSRAEALRETWNQLEALPVRLQ